MKLTQLIEQEERPYICVHTKKGKHETHATSSYDAAKNAAEHWGMKSTAGITAKLADVEHVAEEVITEGPCDIATKDDISKMSGEEYDKYAQWKKDCEAEERTTPLSTKRLESYDDYHGDMSKEEYDKTVKSSEMEYAVWVGGTEVNDKWLSKDEARRLYDKYKAQGYDDVKLDARLKEGSFWGRDDMVAKMKKDELAAGMRKYRKQDGGSYSGTTTSDPEHWERLEADGYEWDKDYYKDIEELEAKWKAKNEGDESLDEWVQEPHEGQKWSGQEKNFIHDLCKRHDGIQMQWPKPQTGADGIKGPSPLWDEGKIMSNDADLQKLLSWVEKNKHDVESYFKSDFRVYSNKDKGQSQSDGNQVLDNIRAKIGSVEEGAKPDFLDLDKDGDKKEPMKKAAKDKKAVNEGDEEELYFNYEDIGGNIIVNPKSTIEDQIGELLDRYYDISPMEFDPSKIEITSSHPSDEDLARNEERTDEILPALSIGGMAGALMSDRKAKRDAEQLNAEEGDDEAEAIAARDEFMKVMDMKGKTPGPGKQIDTIKKIVADKQNMQVAFDDGKMRVDLYTASAVSQVYDAVKPETQVKIDNMLRTKAGMLKMSDFAFSKFNEGLKEGKQLDEILPALAMAARAVAPAVGQALKGVAKAAVKNPVKTAQVVKTVKSDKPITQKAAGVAKITGVTEEELEELQAPYTGADAVIDQNGKKHKPGSPKAQMVINMKKKPAKAANKTIVAKPLQKNKSGVKPAQGTVKPVGRGNAVGSKATQIQPGGGSAAGKAGAVNTAKIKQAKRGAMVGKVKAIGKKVGGFVKDQALKSMDRSGIVLQSKQYADDMVEKAMKDAEEIEEISIRPAPKFKVSGPHGQKPGSHHPPAKSAPRFKASVKF